MKFALLFLFNLAAQSILHGQWSHDPAVNTVLDKPGDQRAPVIATDGHGGAIVAWDEDGGVFANHIDRFGFRQWEQGGVRITPAGRIAFVTNIISDGRGGAVVVWEDLTRAREVGAEVIHIIENEMFVQRVNSTGQLLWPEDGIVIRTKIDSTTIGAFNIVSSDYSDFILFWVDDRKHPYPQTGPFDYYAQKINSDGTLLWQDNGNLISVQASMFNVLFRIAADNAGGFFLARNGNVNADPVIEHISSNGEILTPPGGIQVFRGGGFEIVQDSAGGVIIAGINSPRKATVQKIDNTGNLVWGRNGIVLKDTLTGFVFFDITSDGEHGAIMLWSEGGGENVFLQRVSSDGRLLWSRGGVPVPKAGHLLSDGEGGGLC